MMARGFNTQDFAHDSFHDSPVKGIYDPKRNPDGCARFECLKRFNKSFYWRTYWWREIKLAIIDVKSKFGRM